MKTLAGIVALLGAMLLAAGESSNAFAQVRTAQAPNIQGRVARPGGMCAGIAGLQCPAGQQCVLTGARVADQAGVCRPMRSPSPSPPPAPGHTICPQIVKPVCGVNGVTYPNACIAGQRGVTVVHDGACGLVPPRQPIPPARPQVCPQIWQPVCGVDGHSYPNRCIAESRGVPVRHAGACRRPGAYTPPAAYGDPGEALPATPVPYGSYQPTPYGAPPPPPRYGERG